MADVLYLPGRFVRPAARERSETGTGRGLLHTLRLWRERRRWRREIRETLLPGPDSVLADAGLTRAAAIREARKPFWIA